MLKKLKTLNIDPLIYARFVDDTFIQILSEKDQADCTIKSIKEALNSMDPCLAYTVESTGDLECMNAGECSILFYLFAYSLSKCACFIYFRCWDVHY